MEKNNLEIGSCPEIRRDCRHCGVPFSETGCDEPHEGCDKLHEECGVFGVYSYSKELAVAPCVYHGLVALQHRGQESCGIAVSDRGVFNHHKDMGLVSEVFNKEILDGLPGQAAIGHVRYSTAGGSVRENSQPLVMRYIKGFLGLAHNGNLTNAHELRSELEERGVFWKIGDRERRRRHIGGGDFRGRALNGVAVLPKQALHRLHQLGLAYRYVDCLCHIIRLVG